MELSTTADWSGIIGGIALLATWLWKVRAWFRAKIADAKKGEDMGSNLVSELLNHATSPARRADIHAYILFLCTEMESDHSRHVIHSWAMGGVTLITGILLAVLSQIFDIDSFPLLWWFTIAMYVSLIFAFSMYLFFSVQLRRLQLGWQKKAGNVLRERAFRHVSED